MCAAFLLNALLLCLGPVWAHATQPGPALLLGRLLGPRNHLTLVAHLEQSPGQRHTVTCLEVAEASPTFKYAFPVEAQLLPFHLFAQDAGNCTENIYIRNIIESWDGSPEALCDTASLLLSNSSFADIREKKCTGESDSSSPWVYMLGELGGEPSAAWLQFLPQGMSGPSGRADQSVPPEKTSLLRDRRSDGDLQELQSCIYEHRDAALAPNQGGEIILVIGTTGVGKSTLVSFVTDSDDSLNSVESSTGNFLIEDSSHKIGSGISSKTSVPELITDKR
ncbi:uncharacterized protein LOC113215493 [Frankliniella occidentalis]|uniref:Uncharacterized protein LOC113215493 n=1 Tax=Frankliniella occidentalis TaxID=133901 RepID=A0A6J1TDU0_FRAOC|nr:uncharacterized protein LOC113215493 [Frankliniella occidentalis]